MKSRFTFYIDHTPWAYRYIHYKDGRVTRHIAYHGRYGYKGPPEEWTLVHPPHDPPYDQFYPSIREANIQAYRNINDFQSRARQRSESSQSGS